MKKRKVVNFHWTETTSFWSVIRPGPFAQNPYKDFQFPIFPGKDFLLLLRITWFYFENFKKGGEDTFWMSTKVISLSIHTPHAHCHFKCAGSVAFLATIPASFPPLPLSCPKVSVVWLRQRQHLPPPGTGPLSLVAPPPRRPRGGQAITFCHKQGHLSAGSLPSPAVQSEEVQSCWMMIGVGN